MFNQDGSGAGPAHWCHSAEKQKPQLPSQYPSLCETIGHSKFRFVLLLLWFQYDDLRGSNIGSWDLTVLIAQLTP